MAEVENPVPLNVGRILLEPLNHALAAGSREALKQGVPAHTVIEMLLNHLASVTAAIEPSGSREETVKNLVSSFAPMVQRHLEARLTTPGGVILPRAPK